MNSFSCKKLIIYLITSLSLLSSSFLSAGTIKGYENFDNNTVEKVPTGKGYGDLLQNPTNKTRSIAPSKPGGSGFCNNTSSGCGINYRYGAKVLTHAIDPITYLPREIFYIYYGSNWTINDKVNDKDILDYLANHIGSSDRFKTNTTYYSKANSTSTKIPVQAANFVVHTCRVSNYLGNNLSDANIAQIVLDSTRGTLLTTSYNSDCYFPTKNPNAVYFVLTDKDTTATSGFCTSYCGWHSKGSFDGATLQYSFVGNAESKCPNSCIAGARPNASLGADGMASVIVHELEEAVTDPWLNAWYDSRGYENSDKCAWKFGTPYNVTNSANEDTNANVSIGPIGSSRHYYIQQNWVNATNKNGTNGYCDMGISQIK
jgi:hypothetical protein